MKPRALHQLTLHNRSIPHHNLIVNALTTLTLSFLLFSCSSDRSEFQNVDYNVVLPVEEASNDTPHTSTTHQHDIPVQTHNNSLTNNNVSEDNTSEHHKNLAASIREDLNLPDRSPSYVPPQLAKDTPTAKNEITVETTQVNTSPIVPLETGPKKHVVALLLPLSGKYKHIGEHLLNSAEIAIFAQNNPNLILKPFDTQATEDGALNAYKSAKKEAPSMIIGPVFSATTWAILRTETPEVPLVSFSNDSSLIGRGIYLFGFDPTLHIRRILEYATSQGITDYVALAPDNSYGILTTRELSSFLHDSQLPEATMEWYADAHIELSKSLERIARATADKKVESVGLLIPEGGKSRTSIVKRLKNGKYRFAQFKLLGSGEWDTEATARNRDLIGSWFATTSPRKRKEFRKEYETQHSKAPIRIGSLAYDSIFLAQSYIEALESANTPITLDKLKQLDGLNGRYYFHPDGRPERNLSVVEVTRYGFNVIDE